MSEQQPCRVALLGLMLESNSFAPVTTEEDYVNRVYLAGDEILKAFVALVSRNIRQSDLLARYGGDEFAIILPEAGPDAALKFCEKLRAMVEAHDFQFQGQAIEVTTSVGLQSYEHTDGGKTVRQLVAAADAHLYEAKKSGRNRICTGRFT